MRNVFFSSSIIEFVTLNEPWILAKPLPVLNSKKYKNDCQILLSLLNCGTQNVTVNII